MRLLLVEDDKMIGEGLKKALRKSAYAVDLAPDVATADEALAVNTYDAVILDVGLPDGTGLDVLKRLRARKDATPVLVLTARDGVSDRVEGLDTGADDYMLKPFALEELEARLRSLLRRHQAGGQDRMQGVLQLQTLTLNPKTHEVRHDGKAVAVTAKEFAVLHALMAGKGAILSRAQLEESLYGWDEEVASNAIEVHIHQLRKKLGSHMIKNVRNMGYTMGEGA